MLYTRNPSGSTPDFTLAYSPECVEVERRSMKKAETKWWVVALWVVLAAVLVGLLLAGGMGGLFPPE
jgi:hypothetical protein